MGVDRRSVKRWESDESANQLPDDGWAWLLEARGAMHEDARIIACQIAESFAEVPGAGEVVLGYYRTQDALDVAQAGSGADEPVGYANARIRLVARLLEQKEIPYRYEFAEE